MVEVFRTIIFLAPLLTLMGGCQSWTTPPIKADISTPKSAAMAYLKAIAAGDARTAVALSEGTPEQQKWVVGRATLVDGMRKFDNALYAHFGNVTSQVHTDMHDTLLTLADIWVTSIDAGTVSFEDNQARVDPHRAGYFTRSVLPISLVHQKAGWKVDLSQTYAPGATPEQTIEMTAACEQWRTFGEVFRSVAADISAKKFHSSDEASRALYDRLAKLRKEE